jgi:hypothetical protein
MYRRAALSTQWQVETRGEVPSASSSRWLKRYGGRATAKTCLNRCYGACACAMIARLGPLGTEPRRGPLAALPAAGVWLCVWGDGAPCPARSATPPNGQRHRFRGTSDFFCFCECLGVEFPIGGHASVGFRVGGHARWLWPLVVDKSISARILLARGSTFLNISGRKRSQGGSRSKTFKFNPGDEFC